MKDDSLHTAAEVVAWLRGHPHTVDMPFAEITCPCCCGYGMSWHHGRQAYVPCNACQGSGFCWVQRA